ncbi:MAG: 4-hydroxy-tetrahydrodipicolinate reductase [Oscillospiraceae bacterium]|nr:4-hydroxy-tetrahydrodipicolinate reductase [Candidatus Equicaccousia limihippi]
MLKIILSGCSGHMGHAFCEIADTADNVEIVAGVDPVGCGGGFPVVKSFDLLSDKGDCIVDFSHPSALAGLLEYAEKTSTPAVICTTGLSEEQIENIKCTAKKVPIFFSFNMSLGVNLMTELVAKAAQLLEGFDIEIIEKHHNQKLDAPSGTALMLVESMENVLGKNMKHEYDRHSKREKRTQNEIGIHSVRGGNIVGEHEVLFCGNDEVLSVKHIATSKKNFANGALCVAKFLQDKPAGLYSMKELVKE